MGGHAERSGVRHRHRDAVHPDGEPYAVPLHQLDHGRDERLPPGVRFRAAEQQELHTGVVADGVQREHRRLVRLEVVDGERHLRPLRAVVVQLVHGEAGEQPVRQGVEQVLGQARARLTGVDEAVHGVDQHRSALHRLVVDDLVQVLGSHVRTTTGARVVIPAPVRSGRPVLARDPFVHVHVPGARRLDHVGRDFGAGRALVPAGRG